METSISTRPKPIASKVVLIGDAAVGKTAIRNRFLSGQFTASYKATIGADFFTKTIDIKGQQVSMQIWDTAGQERFRSLGAAFYRGADSVCLCFSIIDRKSLQHVADWFAEFKARCPVDQGREGDMTWICIANKLDLKSSVTGQEAVSEEEAQALLDELLPPTIAEDDDEEEDGVETPKASSHIQQQLHFLPPVAKPPHYPSHDAFEEGERRPRANNNLDQLPSVKAAVEDEDDSQLASQPTASIDILTPTDFYRRKHSNSQSARKLSTTASSHSVYHTPSASWDPNLRTSSPPLPLNDVDPDFDDAVTPLANPSSFINGNLSSSHQKTKSEKQNLQIPEPKPPSRGIKLFLTSAKTGQNLDQLFEYCAQHIYDRLRYKEYQKQLLNGMDGQSDEFDLANVIGTSKNGPLKVGPPAGAERKGWKSRCC